ncbi:3-hydroxyacyl-ACP dehydratase FabZ family protein [Streptomyces sp. TS71-3]|uniref:3-hydroxyacyl-ACP dehydratase FabZ family protein n=1 Tax=Streptomyces sp. TS71-3 TaxID=2733862 RepID=UPI001B17439A|nr:beta-hydroxyacyl-ACP dehydratase [Streptomyces sp. TS71-3]GHJ36852.1 3-hydroxyacyl-[acyl-carrier-protein] dehydratase FabZ [Streptomyces sp. TS71-3]
MMTASAIKATLPHRFPMLLVDRVVELVPGERLTALKAVTCNEPWYRDVPDGAPEDAYGYPPVLLVESWCQAAGVLAAWDTPNPDVLSGQVMLFGGISGVRFHDQVLPGDVLEHRVRLIRALTDTVIFEGETLADGRTVVEIGRVVMATRPASELAAGGPVQAMSAG